MGTTKQAFEARKTLVYEMIRRAARTGQRCPTNQQIRDVLQSNSTNAAQHVIDALAHDGKIRVTRTARCRRVVTIVADGTSTIDKLPRANVEALEKGVQLVREGATARSAAEQVPGITAGQLKHYINEQHGGLAKLRPLKQQKGPATNLRVRTVSVIRTAKARAKAKRAPMRDAVGAPEGTQEPRGCRYIYGDPDLQPQGWRFCSRKTWPAESWCPGHAAMVFGGRASYETESGLT